MPIFFGGGIFDYIKLEKAFMGFISFCVILSAVYIFNDLYDIEKDRKHPTKKSRPLASGKISKRSAIIMLLFCIICAIA